MSKNHKDQPLISVIMGVYNSQETLVESVTSILNQSYPNFEFLICDDSSTDDSLKLLSDFGDKRIKIIKNETNRGLAYSLNKCLSVSKGEYVARMDADDLAYPDRFEKQLSFLEAHRDIDAVGSSVSIWNGKSIVGIRNYPELPTAKHLIKSNPFAHPTMMLRKTVYEILGGYKVDASTKRAEDLDLWFRFFKRGFTGYNIQSPLLRYTEKEIDFKKRTISAAIGIAKVYQNGYRMLGFPKAYDIYATKPIISAITPTFLKLYLRDKNLSK